MDSSKPFVLEGEDGKYTMPTNSDFKAFKAECEGDEGWSVFTENEKEGFKMWTKKVRIFQYGTVAYPRSPRAATQPRSRSLPTSACIAPADLF